MPGKHELLMLLGKINVDPDQQAPAGGGMPIQDRHFFAAKSIAVCLCYI